MILLPTKKIRNKVTRMKFAARSKYCKLNLKIAKLNNQGIRKTWEIVNEIIDGSNKATKNYPRKMNLKDGEQTTENSDTIADL